MNFKILKGRDSRHKRVSTHHNFLSQNVIYWIEGNVLYFRHEKFEETKKSRKPTKYADSWTLVILDEFSELESGEYEIDEDSNEDLLIIDLDCKK